VAAKITTLIDKLDEFETLSRVIADILVVESDKQRVLAAGTAGKDPDQWRLRVFEERSSPFTMFQDIDAETPDPEQGIPIVNVAYANDSFDAARSNIHERQCVTGVWHIDCFGVGISRAGADKAQENADETAALEAKRACRLVRNILMASHYVSLGLAPWRIARRWVQSRQMLEIPLEPKTVQSVACMRLTFEVTFNEFAPQIEGVPLEYISVTMKRPEDGMIVLRADFPFTDPPAP
jgi:hypothetical protein